MGRAEDIFERIKAKGEEAITEFVQTWQCEELFLDFKRSADQGKGRVLDQKDRNNLAKAISGFGNSEGGVIVWGVDCSKDAVGADVVKAKYPIFDVEKFRSWIEGAVSGCTIPPHAGVLNHVVEINAEGHGYVVTYIPKSENVPHQTVKDLRYYIRAGSSFSATPHQVLAGMFGRRPQPKLIQKFVCEEPRIEKDAVVCMLGFAITNLGSVVARDLFVNCQVFSMPGSNCTATFNPKLDYFTGFQSFGFSFSITSNDSFKLPPEGVVPVAHLEFIFRPPFEKKFRLGGVFGGERSPPYRFGFERSAKLVGAMYNDVMNHKGTSQEQQACKDFWEQIVSPETSKS